MARPDVDLVAGQISSGLADKLRQVWPILVQSMREEIADEWAEGTSTLELRERLYAEAQALERMERRLWRAIDNG